MKRILIADDHSIARAGICVVAREEFQHAEIDECSDGNMVWKKMKTNKYDLLVLDISMPGMDSVSLLKNIISHYADQKVLIISMNSEEVYAKKYLKLGAMGFINKEANGPELRRALATVMNNKLYLSPRMQDLLALEGLEENTVSPFNALSARELEVLRYLLEGKKITEIGRLLCIQTSTAGTHKARILQKLNVSNLVELNKMAQLFGI